MHVMPMSQWSTTKQVWRFMRAWLGSAPIDMSLAELRTLARHAARSGGMCTDSEIACFAVVAITLPSMYAVDVALSSRVRDLLQQMRTQVWRPIDRMFVHDVQTFEVCDRRVQLTKQPADAGPTEGPTHYDPRRVGLSVASAEPPISARIMCGVCLLQLLVS